MSDEPPRKKRRFARSRLAVAVVLGVSVAWLTIAIVASVSFALFGYGSKRAEVVRLPYTVGGDNRAVLTRCTKRLRRLYEEVKGRMVQVAPEDLGARGERKWGNWVAHLRERMEHERARCHLDGDAPDPDDAALAEMTDLLDAIEALTDHYVAKRKRLVRDFSEEFVAIEGLFGRVDARIKGVVR